MAKRASTLDTYDRKRDFTRSPEPRGGKASASSKALSFVVQKHHARQLHYDFRLELDGRLLSWAVPKGPCLDPKVKRMAVEVEDHPLTYGGFEGTIPPGNYGAGTVIVWDNGTWLPVGDPHEGLAKGDLKFDLQGHKLHGRWVLVRIRGRDGEGANGKQPWLLIKERDGQARPLDDYDVLVAEPGSVLATPRAKAGKTTSAPAAPAAAATPSEADPPVLEPPRAALPAKLSPQLATLAAGPPPTPGDWLYELKYDGYRLLCRIDGRSVKCFTRNGHDWTDKLPQLAKALRTLSLKSGWIDGEIVVEDEDGAPDFQALQNAFDSGSTANIVYWIFDVPFLDGRDLRGLPFEQRSVLLPGLLGADSPPMLRVSEAFDADPRDMLVAATRLGFEGIVGKRRDAHYVSTRSPHWIKLKGGSRQEFVVGGYTRPQGGRTDFGALLLGVHDDAGQLRYCGSVGTGFDQARLADVRERLDKLASPKSPFADPLPGTVKVKQFAKPSLVAEIAFAGWTRDSHLRHPVFQGLRDDKPARQVRRERATELAAAPAPLPAQKAGASQAARTAPPSIRITNADRVIDSASGSTKGALVDYYARVAPLILPHLKGRPVSLVRAPDGVGGELFFQKHAQGRELPHVTQLDRALDPGHPSLLQIDQAEALLSVAQMNTIELHTWNATSRAIDRPDRFCLDLDPGEGLGWPRVIEAAQLVHALLDELGLAAFLKTSGGKGLHVVVPVRRHYDWDAVKGFSQAIVQHLAQHLPDRFVAISGPRNRVGKIFVDYLRNGFGATTVSAWSVRARPGLGVSVPVDWSELSSLESGAHWTLADVDARRSVGNGPWTEMEKSRNGLASAMRKLGYVPPAPTAKDKAEAKAKAN
ncbi:DNA ligase D [Variovorax dokdonensis]|uniref:DNA ligase (ATP) n=1 Tax=Variovorax dokdonensis TaxID=344883 RepID=A0ABT7NAD7_9BURK|nr:DNA ligase D [Variovorax dokdonensis]MDM0044908.1 DNA ligase D [Variovorax dokdonensis]